MGRMKKGRRRRSQGKKEGSRGRHPGRLVKRRGSMSEINDIKNRASLPVSPDKGGMRLFAELFVQLGTSTKTNDKLEALTEYFAGSDDRDKVWVIALFSGRKPKRTVNATQLA